MSRKLLGDFAALFFFWGGGGGGGCRSSPIKWYSEKT